jgi:tetratricopeptide (TPR) repeat protein
MAPADLLAAVLRAASEGQLTQALTRLARGAENHEDLAATTRDALDQCLPELFGRAIAAEVNPELREALRLAVERLRPGAGAVAVADLPTITRTSAPLITEVLLTAAVALEPGGPDQDPDAPLDEIAWTHDHLSTSFSLIGRTDWAVLASRRAATVRRRLVELNADSELPMLAGSLTNLSVHLSRLDRHDEALDADTEAVAILRGLVSQHGADDRFALATALTNLSVSLGALDRSVEALAASTEAVELRRATADTASSRADLAHALHSQAVDLGRAGHDIEALHAVEEAVSIRRHLARLDPDRFTADLAESLNNLSVRLGAVGRRADALTAIREAVRIRRALVEIDPDLFLPGLATSLNNLSVDLSATGAPAAESLSATTEAMQIRRSLARDQPERFTPDLATVLQNMAADLAAAGRPQDALQAVREAVQIRRTLAERQFERYAPDLARSLRTLAARLTPAGRPDESVTAAQEAVELFQTLARTRRDAFLPELASSLSSLAIRLRAVERYPQALAASEESVRLYRDLATAAPDTHLPRLASALNRLTIDLSRADRQSESLAAADEVVRIRRALTPAEEHSRSSDLAIELDNLASRLRTLDRPEDALAIIEEVVRIRRELVPADRRAQLPRLVSGLTDLAACLVALDRTDEVAPLLTQLADDYRDDPWATGVIALGRGWWHAEHGDVATAIADARSALDRLHSDPSRQGEARTLLQTMRHANPDRFDLAWDDRAGEQPQWLRHLRRDDSRRALIRAWYACPTPEEAERFLTENAATLLTEETLTTLGRLIDDNPDNNMGLRLHRNIVDAARARGVATAYDEYRSWLWRTGVQDALTAWFEAKTTDELRQHLDNERVLLLSEEAQTQVENALAADPGNPNRLWRTGLLGLCRLDGAAAFTFLKDHDALRHPPDRRGLNAFEPRMLAVGRIRAGREPDDPEAAFSHAELALVAGKDAEADAAIARCAQSSTSWDRRTRAGYLTDATTIRPDLAEGWTRLRSIMATQRTAALPEQLTGQAAGD